MGILLVIDMSKNKKVSVAVGSAIVVTVVAAAGYCIARRFEYWRELREEIAIIPWPVSKEYKSWKTFFRSPRDPKPRTTIEW